MRFWTITLGVWLLLAGTPAEAERLLVVSGDVGIGGVGTAAVSTVQSGIDLRLDEVSAGVFGRVRLMLKDSERVGLVRRRDFDEAGDYAHLLRYFDWRHTFGETALTAHAGELLGVTLGRGTLMRDYCNVADPDHLQAGLRFDVEDEAASLTALLDNLVRPRLTGVYGAWRPLPSFRGFALRATGLVDVGAPNHPLLDAEGQRLLDRTYRLETTTAPLFLGGLGAEVAIGDADRAQLAPYVDVNSSWRGVGGHFGAAARLAFGNTPWVLGAQVEYRLTSGGYAPDAVDTLYDVTRYQPALAADPASEAVPTSARETLLEAMRRGAFAGQGVMGQLSIEAARALALHIGVRRHAGPDSTRLWTRLVLAPWRKLSLGFLVMARGVGEPEMLRGLAVLAEGRYRFNRHFYALAQYSRVWAMDETWRQYGPLQTVNLAVGASWGE